MYRDMLDRCPRCGTELTDAKAARGCEGCRGLWLGLADLGEMVAEMQPMYEHLPLEMTPQEREPVPCPACTEPMRTLVMHGVAIDVCGKRHGVWFDANELGTLLLRSAVRLG